MLHFDSCRRVLIVFQERESLIFEKKPRLQSHVLFSVGTTYTDNQAAF